MVRGKTSIPSSSDDSNSDDVEGEGRPSLDELVDAVIFFEYVCTKQKAQLKTLKNKLLSTQNDYKFLLEKFETFANNLTRLCKLGLSMCCYLYGKRSYAS